MRSSLPLLLLPALLGMLPVAASAYHVDRVLPIGGSGGWDYLTVDSDRGLLFVPRTTHTEVIDPASGRVVADLDGQQHNHGVALVPSAGRGFITDGGAACVWAFDLATWRVLGKFGGAEDADGIVYDPASGKLLIAGGDAAALFPLAANANPAGGAVGPAIALGGKPEFLAVDGRGRAYVDLVDQNQVAVVDTRTMTVVAKWPTAPGGAPTGLAIDRAGHRLFIGCRRPQRLIVMDADNGKILGALPIGAGVDATAFDQGCAFASCRDGTLAVAREVAGAWALSQTVATAPGARTLGVDAKTHALYLPTAKFSSGPGRPAARPGSFMIVAVKP